MANKLDELRWKLFTLRYNILFKYGAKNGLIKQYDKDLIERLRHVYCGGIPGSILLLHGELSNGYCQDRASLITLGFGEDDFQVVYASVDNIKLNPEHVEDYRKGNLSENYAVHCFAERTCKDGIVWVYDTSIGFVFEKNLYYLMENAKVRLIKSKQNTLDFLYKDFLRDSDIERDKESLPLILPSIEGNLTPTQPFYLDHLKEEIEILKKEVDYKGICEEFNDDMMRKGLL